MSKTPLDLILAKMRLLASRPERIRGAETEVYYDARIDGDEGYELMEFIVETFGTDMHEMWINEYMPCEGGDFRSLLVRFGKRPFKSLTVADLVSAVEAGRWIETASG